jgi:hypothetical protein
MCCLLAQHVGKSPRQAVSPERSMDLQQVGKRKKKTINKNQDGQDKSVHSFLAGRCSSSIFIKTGKRSDKKRNLE